MPLAWGSCTLCAKFMSSSTTSTTMQCWIRWVTISWFPQGTKKKTRAGISWVITSSKFVGHHTKNIVNYRFRFNSFGAPWIVVPDLHIGTPIDYGTKSLNTWREILKAYQTELQGHCPTSGGGNKKTDDPMQLTDYYQSFFKRKECKHQLSSESSRLFWECNPLNCRWLWVGN